MVTEPPSQPREDGSPHGVDPTGWPEPPVHPGYPGYPPAYPGQPAAYPGYPGYPPAYPGYPPGLRPEPPEASDVRAQAIIALCINLIAIGSCCALLSIPAVVTSGLAIGRVDTDLPTARRLVTWSWGLLAGNVVLVLLVAVAWFGLFTGMGTAFP